MRKTKKQRRRIKRCETQIRKYFQRVNVYLSSDLGYNLRDLSRYAQNKGCKIADLTKEEIEQFCVKS